MLNLLNVITLWCCHSCCHCCMQQHGGAESVKSDNIFTADCMYVCKYFVWIHMCVQFSKVTGMNKKKQWYLPNRQYLSSHWCERKNMAAKGKISNHHITLCMHFQKQIHGHRYERTNRAVKCNLFAYVTWNFIGTCKINVCQTRNTYMIIDVKQQTWL